MPDGVLGNQNGKAAYNHTICPNKTSAVIQDDPKNRTRAMSYETFLQRKKRQVSTVGFSPKCLNKHLFDFQEFLVRVALKKAKFALFADCGQGKTIMYLSWAKAVVEETKKPVLILNPLAVVGQTIEEGRRFGVDVLEWLDEFNSFQNVPEGIYITNYETLSSITVLDDFAGIVLDESSILKNFDGANKKLIIESFTDTPFKLACTATPSPNDDMEICNHAEFLGVGTRAEILAMYFTHDGGETAKWRLKGHAEDRFWEFVSQWAIMVSNPSDIGFDGSKYVLPEINYIKREIKTPIRSESSLFNDIAISATNFNQELRLTRDLRLAEVASIVNSQPDENFIVWIHHNEEGEILKRLIPGAIEVKGSDSREYKKDKLLGFARNEFRVLITKAKIAQFGLNYQNCRNQIFASPDFSFETLYQAIRRSYRFGQKNIVNIYLIVTDTMQNVMSVFTRKDGQFTNMKNKLKKHAAYEV
jgi:hypothetical protein